MHISFVWSKCWSRPNERFEWRRKINKNSEFYAWVSRRSFYFQNKLRLQYTDTVGILFASKHNLSITYKRFCDGKWSVLYFVPRVYFFNVFVYREVLSHLCGFCSESNFQPPPHFLTHSQGGFKDFWTWLIGRIIFYVVHSNCPHQKPKVNVGTKMYKF